MKQIFVTGTDTGIGKTVVSALLTVGLNASYWKPIQSGAAPSTDTEWIRKHTELPEERFFKERYVLQKPLSPHISSALENISISLEEFHLPTQGPLIVEGAGGVMVPINERGDLIVDLIKKLNLPTVVVARSTLGTINHTLLTLRELHSRHIPALGVVLNGPKNRENRKSIEKYGQIPILGEIEPEPQFSPQVLKKLFQEMRGIV